MLDGTTNLFLATHTTSVHLLYDTHCESGLQKLNHGNVVVQGHFLPIVHEVVRMRLHVTLKDRVLSNHGTSCKRGQKRGSTFSQAQLSTLNQIKKVQRRSLSLFRVALKRRM